MSKTLHTQFLITDNFSRFFRNYAPFPLKNCLINNRTYTDPPGSITVGWVERYSQSSPTDTQNRASQTRFRDISNDYIRRAIENPSIVVNFA